MDIKWHTLGQVAVVSFGATVGIVIVFTLGVRALVGREEARAAGGAGTGATIGAGACFLACACAVLYGLYLIIPQFH